MFSPSLLQSPSTSRRQAVDLAKELGCVTSDFADDAKMAACLRAAPVHVLNAAQTKVDFKNQDRSSRHGLRDRSPGFYMVCVCVCVAAVGGQRSVSVLVSGPSVRLSVVLPQSRPVAGNI